MMAKLYPNDIWTQVRAAGNNISLGQRAEFETLRRLEQSLPEDLLLFYSVDWAYLEGRRLHAREVDFVIANRRGQCVFIEQKMGRLEETPQGLAKAYGDTRKDIVQQVLDSLNGLKANFKRANADARPLDVSYLLYCPNHRVADLNAAGLDPDCIIDATRAKQLPQVLKDRLGGPVKDWTDQGQRLQAFLKQLFRLTPDVGSTVDLQETRFIQLTENVMDVLANLEASPLRLYISGVAGCGKTLIARHYYEQSLAQGKTPLLVCYNTQLRDRFQATLEDGGTVDTFLGLLKSVADRPGSGIDFDPAGTDPRRWNHLREEVALAMSEDDAVHDRLIVDEGQDLTEEAYESLRLFLKDGADVIWMEDADQDLGQRAAVGGAFDPAGFWRLTLRRNYRSPLRIARFMHETLPFDFEPANALPGSRSRVAAHRNPEEQRDQVEESVRRLLGNGYDPSDIAVVTTRGLESSPLYGADHLGGLPVKRFMGAYAEDRPVFSEGKLLFDSVRRFKGLQAPAILLVDVDPRPDRDIDLRALYCGMSRATVHLEVFAKRDNAFNKDKLLRS